MTVTPWQIYLITRLDSLNTVLAELLAVSLVVLTVGIAFILNEDAIDDKAMVWVRRTVAVSGVLAPLLMLSLVFIPTSKEAAAMLAIPKVVNSTLVREDIPEVVKELCRKVLDKESK